jgi:hypothetical protein
MARVYTAPMFMLLVAALSAAEPAGVARVVKGADKATVDAALAGVDACAGKLASADMRGLACRLLVVEAQSKRAPIVKDVDVDARVNVVVDALAAAEHVWGYRAQAPEPGLGRARFDAHRAACAIAFSAVADLQAIPSEFPAHARAQAQLAGTASTSTKTPSPPSSPPSSTTLQERACACAARSVDLAVVADASPAETTEVQGVLTRQRCSLGRAGPALGVRTGPGAALGGADGALKTAADDASPQGRLAALARGRLVEMSRCTAKHTDGERVTDVAKLTSCACGVAQRWALPFRKDDPPVSARLPLRDDDKLWLPVVVEAGAIARCADVEGALVAR